MAWEGIPHSGNIREEYTHKHTQFVNTRAKTKRALLLKGKWSNGGVSHCLTRPAGAEVMSIDVVFEKCLAPFLSARAVELEMDKIVLKSRSFKINSAAEPTKYDAWSLFR